MNEDIFRYNFNKNNRSCRQGTLRYTNKKIGRNKPCPCGSEKKYKKCCGKRFSDNRCHM